MDEIGRSLLRGVVVGWGTAVSALVLVLLRAAIAPPAGASEGRLLFPVPDAPAADLTGHFDEPRGERVHLAVDVAARRGTPVVAVTGGWVERVGTLGNAGLSIDLRGRSGRRCYFYAHLDSTSPGLVAGGAVARGQVLGTVGTTGNAPESAPHLHFAVRDVAPGERCWSGEPVDPAPLLESAIRPGP